MQFSPQPRRFRNWSKVMLDPDFSVTAWVVSKCPQWGQRPHTKATMPQVGGGVCICAALVWGGREDQLLVQVGGGSPRLWRWRGIFGHAHVAYLIDRGHAPLLLTWLTGGARPCCLLDRQWIYMYRCVLLGRLYCFLNLLTTIQFAIEIGRGSKMSKDHSQYSRWLDDVKSWNVKWICYNTIILITKAIRC
jgi:hypothetical protein